MYQEHAFAQYIRILGKGKNGSRSYTEEEAYSSFLMVLKDEVTPEQLGAYLMLLRVKEETGEEIAGFVRAAKEYINAQSNDFHVDLDWSSYAGKRRHLPWFILTALLLAENGTRVFMHGASGHTNGRIYTRDVLSELGFSVATTLDEAKETINQTNFAYMDIEHLCPKLHKIIELRPFLGLRSPVHTLSRMINPFNAAYMMQGIFHPGYHPTHQQAGLILQQPHMAVIKGDGGEIERNPDMKCLVQSVHNGEMIDEEWPPMFKRRHVKDETLDIKNLIALWRGDIEYEYGMGAVVGTLAITLKMMGKANNIDEAESLAKQMWNARPKDKYQVAA